eukprot:scaffold115189_cov84-Phaeocystis_antarctica.AAC.1
MKTATSKSEEGGRQRPSQKYKAPMYPTAYEGSIGKREEDSLLVTKYRCAAGGKNAWKQGRGGLSSLVVAPKAVARAPPVGFRR